MCDDVVADGLPKGPGIPTEVYHVPAEFLVHEVNAAASCWATLSALRASPALAGIAAGWHKPHHHGLSS